MKIRRSQGVFGRAALPMFRNGTSVSRERSRPERVPVHWQWHPMYRSRLPVLFRINLISARDAATEEQESCEDQNSCFSYY